MSKQPPSAPTVSAVGPCPTVIQIVGRPGTGSLPSTIAPPDHPLHSWETVLAFSVLLLFSTGLNSLLFSVRVDPVLKGLCDAWRKFHFKLTGEHGDAPVHLILFLLILLVPPPPPYELPWWIGVTICNLYEEMFHKLWE